MHIYHGIYHNTYHHIYHGIYHDIYYGIYYGIYHAPVEAIMQLIASLSSTAPYSMVSSTFFVYSWYTNTPLAQWDPAERRRGWAVEYSLNHQRDTCPSCSHVCWCTYCKSIYKCIYHGMLHGIYHCIYHGIYSNIYHAKYHDIYSDIYLCIHRIIPW